MSLRIVGGRFKGRILKSPKTPHTRPTSNMLRKAVFDICRPDLSDAKFLDLFAGSGAIGFEALSQGAGYATFVDLDVRCIEENAKLLKAESECTILKGDVKRVLSKLKGPFDLIYIDPPYDLTIIPEVLQFLDQSDLVTDGGTVFAEEVKGLDKLSLKHLKLVGTRKFGKSLLHQFRRHALIGT